MNPLRFLIGLVAALALLAQGSPAQAGGRAGAVIRLPVGLDLPVVQFGIKGGNIRPWQVSIALDGTITASGVSAAKELAGQPQPALNGLLTLAKAEHFFRMPQSIECSGTLPDVASSYITFTTTAGTRSVTVHGSCHQGFTQLFNVLYSIGQVSR